MPAAAASGWFMNVRMFHGSDSIASSIRSARAATHADGHAAAQRLAGDQHVRADAEQVARPGGAAPGHAGLDLVHDQEHVPLAAGALDGLVVAGREQDVPVRPLDDLHDEGGDLAVAAVEGAFQRAGPTPRQAKGPSPSGLR